MPFQRLWIGSFLIFATAIQAATVTVNIRSAGWGDESTTNQNGLAWGFIVDSNGNIVDGDFGDVFLEALAANLDGFSLPSVATFSVPVLLFDEYYFVRSRGNTINGGPLGGFEDGFMSSVGVDLDAPVESGDDYGLLWFSVGDGILSSDHYFGFQDLGELPAEGATVDVDSVPALATNVIGVQTDGSDGSSGETGGSDGGSDSSGDSGDGSGEGSGSDGSGETDGSDGGSDGAGDSGDGSGDSSGSSGDPDGSDDSSGSDGSSDGSDGSGETGGSDGGSDGAGNSGGNGDSSEGSWYAMSVDLGGEWRWFEWLGFFNVSNAPWIYHQEHGWLLPFADSPESVFFWEPEMESFLWTSENVYPSLYRFSDSKWIFYDKGSSDPRWFVDLATGVWEPW